MDKGKIVFSQLMECLPHYEFQKCVEKYKGEYKVNNFSCTDQFLSMAFAQLTYRDSLRDTVTSLESVGKRLYHMGIRTKPTRNNLAHANAVRDRRIFQEFALILVERAIRLSGDLPLDSDIDLREAVYALVVILKRQLRLPQSPCTILQVLSIVIFEKDVIAHILTNNDLKSPDSDTCKLLTLFD